MTFYIVDVIIKALVTRDSYNFTYKFRRDILKGRQTLRLYRINKIIKVKLKKRAPKS